MERFLVFCRIYPASGGLKRFFGEEVDKFGKKHFLSVSYDTKQKILNTKKGQIGIKDERPTSNVE